MAAWVAMDVVKAMLQRRIEITRARVLVLGITFKENCPDIRNTKVADLVRELSSMAADVTTYDPLADAGEVSHEYGIKLAPKLPDGPFDAIVLAVRHSEFVAMGEERLRSMLAPHGVSYDLKEVLPLSASDARL